MRSDLIKSGLDQYNVRMLANDIHTFFSQLGVWMFFISMALDLHHQKKSKDFCLPLLPTW